MDNRRDAYPPPKALVKKESIMQLMKEVNPAISVDSCVNGLIMDLLDDFVEDLIDKSTDVAAARDAKFLRGMDIAFVLERCYDMYLAGMAPEAPRARLSIVKEERAVQPNANDDRARHIAEVMKRVKK